MATAASLSADSPATASPPSPVTPPVLGEDRSLQDQPALASATTLTTSPNRQRNLTIPICAGFLAAGFAWFYIFALTVASVCAFILAASAVQVGIIRRWRAPISQFTGPSSPMWAEALKRADVLPAPVTEVTTESLEGSDGTRMVACCMQGWRRSMEDGHIAVLGYNGDPETHILAVFDGHCGKETAQWCGAENHVVSHIEKAMKVHPGDPERALQMAFLELDATLLRSGICGRSGATACLVYVTAEAIYCANAGDSRAVLSSNRGRVVQALSVDHKPTLPGEAQRIRGAKGFVWNRRVNGILALSRALGDFAFKQCHGLGPERQAVTALPDVMKVLRRQEEQDFIVVACDGIWDVLSNEQVVQMLRSSSGNSPASREAIHGLLRKCLSPHPFGLGCDNMTVVVLAFKTSIQGQRQNYAVSAPTSSEASKVANKEPQTDSPSTGGASPQPVVATQER